MDLGDEVAKAQALLQTHSPSSVAASLGLAVFCVCVDRLLLLSLVQQHAWLRAAVDNGAHGAIGLWSWAIVVGLRTWSGVWESVLAGCLASAVDLDHFYLAGSFSLEAALNLPRRPPLHCSSLILLLCGSLHLLVGACRLGPLWRPLPWLLFISLASHHIRDGTRRGLWVWPLGDTPPLPYWLYVAITATLPQLCSVLMGVLGTREADSRRHKAALDV
ncbi:transmembrane protein 267 [Brienomyrus brachyistius]|uniref:transmembrane protein 267 n=1 Tax=Brienomyrus brachyistius TaxID=42636 RepID=UPI0020B33506|nr:transmembrane protein 267 [Brienomyrus brachyistius]XP_048835987.1 transmembrane protein 267 [Brienomyrus brachyistius]XP_048835988.1 transmembrane protein 267 [Brienomyrus brachyistius]